MLSPSPSQHITPTVHCNGKKTTRVPRQLSDDSSPARPNGAENRHMSDGDGVCAGRWNVYVHLFNFSPLCISTNLAEIKVVIMSGEDGAPHGLTESDLTELT